MIVDTDTFGLVAVLPIGMGQVSSVNFDDAVQVGECVEKGQFLGYFLFGGSDCVMLFEESSGFCLTAPEQDNGSTEYGNGYAHLFCGEEYGVMEGAQAPLPPPAWHAFEVRQTILADSPTAPHTRCNAGPNV